MRKQPLGLPYRKEASVPTPLDPYSRRLPDESVPTARIERLRRARPGFVSNRQGWVRFYRWQDWHGRRLHLKNVLCGWDARRAEVGVVRDDIPGEDINGR
jgi:hypothetical protein